DAIGRDEALLDPSELFKANAAENEVDAEDAAYWNVELDEIEGDPLVAEYAALVVQDELQPALEDDPLIQAAIRLGGVVTEIERQPSPLKQIGEQAIPTAVVEAIKGYLDSVHVITDEAKRSALHTELFDLLPASP